MATNRMTSLSGQTPTYDANGALTFDTYHSYTWDSEGHAVTLDTMALTYDALGRMVEQKRGGVYTQIAYGPLGNKLALMNGQTLSKAFVGLPGGAVSADLRSEVRGPSGDDLRVVGLRVPIAES